MEENNTEVKEENVEVKEENVEVNETPVVNEYKPEEKKKGHKGLIIAIIAIVLVAVIAVLCYFLFFNKGDNKDKEKEVTEKKQYNSEYRLSGNELEDFDVYFLKKEINNKNLVYSPLSIKYALAMLNEGTDNDSHQQIESVIGDYKAKKYENSTNMSFANALFIKDEFKEGIKQTYIDTLKERYGAEVSYDSFATTDKLNKWVSDKTFGLIKNLFTKPVDDKDFILINALAINMEWKNLIEPKMPASQEFAHEDFSSYVSGLINSGYPKLKFNNNMDAKAVEFFAVANRYDIVKELGEENMRKTVAEEYKKFLAKGEGCADPNVPAETVVDNYMKEIKGNYGIVNSSTDFLFFDNEEVKVFAKDLKTYGSTTLQYVGIMPKNVSLDEYIKNTNSKKLSEIISNLKEIKLDSFKDGVITEVKGTIPLFKFDYELDLQKDLESMGIVDVFDKYKADLSKISPYKEYIGDAAHKANIEFSNEGIKAAAATQMGGLGGISCDFEYLYEVPVEKIDLTFDKPYMFIIRDKNTKEVWFVGAVYEPIKYKEPNYETATAE